MQIDNLVLSWIQSTIYRDILRSIITPGKPLTAQNAWLKIEKLFRDHVESRIVSLRQDFYHLEKQTLSMNAFLNKLKELFDCRTALGVDVSNRDLIMQIVMGFGSEYNPITSVLITRQPLPTFEECRSLLLMEESKLQKQQSPSSVSQQAFLA